MADHSDLWVAVAAAGPVLVLALAVTVNIYDIRGPMRTVYKVPFTKDIRAVPAGNAPPTDRPYFTLSAYRWKARRRYVGWAAATQLVSWLGFAAAGVATVLALWSLASDADKAPTWSPIALLVVAGACIPVQSRFAVVVRAKAELAEVPLL